MEIWTSVVPGELSKLHLVMKIMWYDWKPLNSYWIDLTFFSFFYQILYYSGQSKKTNVEKEEEKDYLTPPPWWSHQLCLWLPALGWTEWRRRCPTHLTQCKHTVSRFTDGRIVLFSNIDEHMFLTHQKMKRVFFILLDYSSHEELASKQVRRHEGAVLCHPNFIRGELHPVCRLKSQC